MPYSGGDRSGRRTPRSGPLTPDSRGGASSWPDRRVEASAGGRRPTYHVHHEHLFPWYDSRMSDNEVRPTAPPVETKEALTGSGGLRKGADMLVQPPKDPVGDGPAPMPVNMAPNASTAATGAASTPAQVVGDGEGS